MTTNNFHILKREDVSELNSLAFIEPGVMAVLPTDFYRSYSDNYLHNFMLENAIYVLPTSELCSQLRKFITGTAIEVCAGLGSVGRILGIQVSDSHFQADPAVMGWYEAHGQIPIKYPADVEKLDAIDAIDKYQPDTVLGCYVTARYTEKLGQGLATGPREEEMLKRVRRYIHVGNVNTHSWKPLMNTAHKTYKSRHIITRAIDQSLNRVWIWDN